LSPARITDIGMLAAGRSVPREIAPSTKPAQGSREASPSFDAVADAV